MKVAIAGFGIEGRANLGYWQSLGAEVTILDEKEVADIPDGIQIVTGEGAFSNLSGYDMVVRTASLRPDRLVGARKIWSATNEFFAQCPAPIIGVTGTKGKGTTASLITSILSAAGKTVHLVGNIGVPALGVLPTIQAEDVVVFELSSFQLWDLEKSPHIAVVLMIEPDHMDIHKDMGEYVAAKSRISAYQTVNDTVVYNFANDFSRQAATKGAGKKVRYSLADDGGVYVELNNFCVQSNAICSVSTLQIAGQHNVENACAAISAVLAYDVSTNFGDIQKGTGEFTGLPHRLKFVREVRGVRYYDDSIATTQGSAIAALASFDQPKVIILGGSDKGVVYDEIVSVCQRTKTAIVAVGTTGSTVAKLAEQAGVVVQRVEGTMERVVEAAASLSTPGGVVLLSPASASFDQYKSYSDRGDQFIEAVGSLR